jgi:capsular polysaccharide biosynthesis protein
VSDEEEQRTRHRRDQAGPARAAAPAAPWPEAADLSPLDQDDGLTGRLWAFGEFPTEEEETAGDLAAGLTSVGYIRAALRRGRWLWRITAVTGLLIGLAAFKAFPPSYQAQTSILLANNPFEQIGNAVLDDQAIAQSRTVAGAALRKLGLHEDPGIFVGQYTATVLTNRVLAITVKAKSYQAAISEANALAASFLAFQKHQALALAALNNSSLQQSINETKKNVASLTAQIRTLASQPPSPAKRAQMNDLLAQRDEANADLIVLEQTNRANAASLKVNTAALINGSHVLDPAGPLPQHAKKYLVLYVGGGLFAGLMLGLSVVIIRALVSDRLRRRDDIARALGAPVKLSVGKVRLSRWRPGPHGLAAAQSTEIRQIVGHLGRTLPTGSPGVAALAVVPVDDPQVAALSLASLAVSCAQQGLQVALADLCDGAPAARLLGFAGPGAETVHADGTQLLVAVPDPDDVQPAGPLQPRSRRADGDGSLAAACGSAEVLLTLVTVGPSLGADHLASWSRRAIAVVTAGGAPEARVQAVGELIRLAGVELVSAVLVGADETDESLGMLATHSLPASADHRLGP